MSGGPQQTVLPGDEVGTLDVEIILDDGVKRVFAGCAVESLTLRVTVDAVTIARKPPRDQDALDSAVDAFLAERSTAHAHLDRNVAAVLLQAEMLEHFAIPLGDKSIAIFMHRAWTPARADRHGPALAPATLRHWRGRLRGRTPSQKRLQASSSSAHGLTRSS